ncbi:inverse autotransporter beta domain-containing protein [Parachlamydia sp. AcF125]|uniref:inverse autotransporter beta domain-containing protein n=1 Tax=Parachlamydia sp. AcF125 TaxID=2795736 RepID=UPI001BD882D9|nr:hypothetical protein [Parachlamydia sp. AcF125]
MAFKYRLSLFLYFVGLVFQIQSLELKSPQFECRYHTGKFISIDRDYLDLHLFFPLANEDISLFLDTNGYRYDKGKWGASVGGGIRKSLAEGRIIGLNAYYDYLRGRLKRNFHQIGVGFEWLTDCYDIRINGYLPILAKVHPGPCCYFDNLGSGFQATRCSSEYSYGGLEAEIGKSLFTCRDFDLYAAVGPYYFSRKHFKHFSGVHARLAIDWKSLVSIGIRASHDKFYVTQIQGFFAISIPFIGRFSSDLCQDPSFSVQPVRRNGVILTDRCCNWTWNW